MAYGPQFVDIGFGIPIMVQPYFAKNWAQIMSLELLSNEETKDWNTMPFELENVEIMIDGCNVLEVAMI